MAEAKRSQSAFTGMQVRTQTQTDGLRAVHEHLRASTIPALVLASRQTVIDMFNVHMPGEPSNGRVWEIHHRP